MSTPPTVRQITREAIGDVPGWFDRVLQPLNQFLQQAVDALAGNLTVGQNLAQQWLTLTVTEGVASSPRPSPGSRGGPLLVFPWSGRRCSPARSAAPWGWR